MSDWLRRQRRRTYMNGVVMAAHLAQLIGTGRVDDEAVREAVAGILPRQLARLEREEVATVLDGLRIIQAKMAGCGWYAFDDEVSEQIEFLTEVP